MLKNINEYSEKELLDIKKQVETVTTLFAIDKDSCKMIKELAKKHGFEFSYNKKGNEIMFLEYNKYDFKKTFLYDDFTYKGMFFVTMYNDIYLPQKITKFDQDVLDVQFLLDVIQAYYYKHRFLKPELEEFSHEGYPYKLTAIVATYNYLWNDIIPTTLSTDMKSDSENVIPIEAFNEFLTELTKEFFVKINAIYNKIDSM